MLRRGKIFPAALVFYAAYLSFAKTKFARKHNALTPNLSAPRYFERHGFCDFCCYAALAILHGFVLAHVHLVVLMSCPPKIRNVIVGWVPVIVRNVCMIWRWRVAKKRNSNQTMNAQHSMSAVICKVGYPIPTRRRRWIQKNGGLSPVRLSLRFSPLTGFPAPTAQLPVITHLIVFETAHRAPLGGFSHA